MNYEQDVEQLRERLRDLDRKADSSRWLMRQLGGKIAHFPRDVLRRLRRSIKKRRAAAAWQQVSVSAQVTGTTLDASVQRPVLTIFDAGLPKEPPIMVCAEQSDRLQRLIETKDDVRDFVAAMESYKYSDLMRRQVASAIALDPNVLALTGTEHHYLPPWHDADYQGLEAARERLPAGRFDSVILVPFGKLGGADLVAGVLARALSHAGPTLILRTDASDWDRPDWYPEGVQCIDLSDVLAPINNKPRALYALLQHINPRCIYNVNSRLCFETLVIYGERLALQYRLYAYYFCADQTPEGVETGYPVWYFANLIPHLHAALMDTVYLADVLRERYALPPELAGKLRTVYTPVMTSPPKTASVRRQNASSGGRTRQRLLWAGRLDKQKRFDLVLSIAVAMPDIDFDCWGKAVLDAPPDVRKLPKNVTLHPPFASYDELPLDDSDGWLYTSAWDGLPTILIECAARGVPITASAVGGVPELIDEDTGWPVRSPGEVAAYVLAVREMLGNAQARARKVQALQARVLERHSQVTYMAAIAAA